jgi:TatD DNase family protein
VIDTHCHLTFPEYEGRVERVVADAAAAGVTGCITISTTTRNCFDCLRLAERIPNVWCSAGVHPLYADEGPHEWEGLRTVARHAKCVAWGELGLDNHHDTPARDVQHAVLHEQLAFIESCMPEIDLPVEIHCREAFADLIPILRRTRLDPSRFVFHCFTGGPAEMRMILDFGAWVSLTGVVTYKNARALREAVGLLPIDRVMVETDAPYLTPDPFRGVRPNEPKYVRQVAECLAGLYGRSFGEFRAILNETTRRFFPKLGPFPE